LSRWEQCFKGAKGQRDKGTKGQRDKGTKGQRDKGTKGQSREEALGIRAIYQPSGKMAGEGKD